MTYVVTDNCIKWPNVTGKKPPLPDADDLNGTPDKLRFFSPEPGDGDA